jgi:hypothetical protein
LFWWVIIFMLPPPKLSGNIIKNSSRRSKWVVLIWKRVRREGLAIFRTALMFKNTLKLYQRIKNPNCYTISRKNSSHKKWNSPIWQSKNRTKWADLHKNYKALRMNSSHAGIYRSPKSTTPLKTNRSALRRKTKRLSSFRRSKIIR